MRKTRRLSTLLLSVALCALYAGRAGASDNQKHFWVATFMDDQQPKTVNRVQVSGEGCGRKISVGCDGKKEEVTFDDIEKILQSSSNISKYGPRWTIILIDQTERTSSTIASCDCKPLFIRGYEKSRPDTPVTFPLDDLRKLARPKNIIY